MIRCRCSSHVFATWARSALLRLSIFVNNRQLLHRSLESRRKAGLLEARHIAATENAMSGMNLFGYAEQAAGSAISPTTDFGFLYKRGPGFRVHAALKVPGELPQVHRSQGSHCSPVRGWEADRTQAPHSAAPVATCTAARWPSLLDRPRVSSADRRGRP
jgi:hypothetical protein